MNNEQILLDNNRCEFGYELSMMLPYAYYLWNKKANVKVKTYLEMAPFYPFLKSSQMTFYSSNSPRRYGYPNNIKIADFHSQQHHTCWLFPDYSEYYVPLKLNTDRPLLCIFNKYTSEWGHAPINFLNINSLESLFALFQYKYQVIYIHPNPSQITEDHQKSYPFQEVKKLIDTYNVLTPYDFMINSDLTYNECQIRLMLSCKNRLSVQGGNAMIASLSAGKNYIFCKKGKELDYNFCWYRDFGAKEIKVFNDYDSLVQECWSNF
jgi:hypothetical protein